MRCWASASTLNYPCGIDAWQYGRYGRRTVSMMNFQCGKHEPKRLCRQRPLTPTNCARKTHYLDRSCRLMEKCIVRIVQASRLQASRLLQLEVCERRAGRNDGTGIEREQLQEVAAHGVLKVEAVPDLQFGTRCTSAKEQQLASEARDAGKRRLQTKPPRQNTCSLAVQWCACSVCPSIVCEISRQSQGVPPASVRVRACMPPDAVRMSFRQRVSVG